MNITILAVGKKRTEYFEPALTEYQKRLSRWVNVRWHIVPASTIELESQHLLRIIYDSRNHSICVLLDEHGLSWSTPELAHNIETWQNQSVKDVLFVVGGAHGVTAQVQAAVSCVWSLSTLVFPHELVRVLLLEQLYRAYDLNAGGKYHHA